MSDLAEVLAAALGSQYRLERELGGGGMSRVFVAEEIALGRRVAIKVLPPDLSEGITAERFHREIQLAAQLQHPHIVPLLTSGRAGGLVFYIMPYVEGETLRTRLVRDGRLLCDAAVRIARDVAEALQYAHSHRAVHRDIKPENIVLSSGHALVLDFGVAKALRAAGDPAGGTTTAGVALGTPLYMAPEQAAGGGEVDGRADLYALGVVLYETLAGRPPFQSDSAYDLLAAHIADAPEPLRRRSAETPAALEAVVMRCLAKRPTDRYQTAAELVAVLDGLGTPAGGLRPVRKISRKALGVSVAAVALAGAGIGLWGADRFGPDTLVAEGRLKEKEPVILADFENRTADSTLGIAVTEAFRVDLAQSSAVSVAPPVRISGALSRMRRPPGPLDLAVSGEIAQREGIRAVVGGEIAAVGGGYVVSARIVSPATGEVMAGFRETALDADGIIAAVDRVSKQLRRRIGESLGRLETAPSLERATTGSLDALRAYSQGVRAVYAGNVDLGVALLEEAVRLDPAFASAYRMIAVAYTNWDVNRPRRMEAYAQAFRLRDRLPERERQLITAGYYEDIDRRPEFAIQAYESVLREDSVDRVALNNLALLYFNLGQPAKALPLFHHNAVVNPGVMTFRNVLQAEFENGSEAVADSMLSLMESADPNDPNVEFLRAQLAFARQQYDSAAVAFRRLADVHGGTRTWRTRAYRGLASLARLRGRLVEGAAHDGRDNGAAAMPDTSGGEPEVRLALLAARSDIEIRGLADRGIRRVQAVMNGPAWSRMPAVSRPYLDVAYAYAFAGRGELAQAVLHERRRILQQSGLVGQVQLTADAHDPWSAAVRARTLAANGNLGSAIALLQSSVVRRYEMQVLPHLGALHDAAGRADSAMVAYERFLGRRALERHPLDGWYRPGILFRLGELYEQQGDRARAADYYSQFAELWREADSELQPRVAEARRRLATLTAEPGRP